MNAVTSPERTGGAQKGPRQPVRDADGHANIVGEGTTR